METVNKSTRYIVKRKYQEFLSPYGTITLQPGNTLYTFPEGSRSSSYIDRMIKYDRAPDRRWTKNCNHVEYIFKWIPFSGTRYSSSSAHAVESNMHKDDPPWWTASPYPAWPYDDFDSGFNARAFSAMLPDLEQAMNLSVFLLELNDITRLKGLFTKWSGLTKKLAEGHLSYSFGVKPFISDVKKLWNTLTNHQSILEDFLERRGKVQKRYYTEGLQSDSETSPTYSPAGYTRIYHKGNDECQYWASMTYTYDCPDIDNYWQFIQAMRQMLGLRLSASVVWELIPFSFVVDWFWRVGDFLEQFEESVYPVTVKVLEYTVTKKRTLTYRTHLKYYDPYGVWKDTIISTGKSKFYTRRRTTPDSGTTFINRGQYGSNQLALSASLLRLKW